MYLVLQLRHSVFKKIDFVFKMMNSALNMTKLGPLRQTFTKLFDGIQSYEQALQVFSGICTRIDGFYTGNDGFYRDGPQ